MAKTGMLFDLVQSLSMQERRHFKLFARRYGDKQTNYLRLFDVLAGMETYDEGRLRDKLKNEPFIRHLAFEKHRLAGLIRKAMRVYHSERTVDIAIKELLIDAEVLHEKSLYGPCRKLLQRARKAARRYERFAFIPEVTRLESRLFDLDNLDAVYEEEREALEKMQVINSYRQLSNRLARQLAASHHARTKDQVGAFHVFLKDPLMRDERMANSFTAQVYFFYIQAVCREMSGDQEGAYTSRKRFVMRIESNPAQREVHVKNYITSLNNLAISQLGTRRFAEAAETIGKLKAMSSARAGKAEDVQVSSFVFWAILQLNHAIRTGRFHDVLAELPALEKQLKRFEEKILPQFRIVIYNSLKYVYFGAGALRKALQWSNKVLAAPDQGVRQDIRAMARIFNLILHYELGNTDHLEYIIKSTYRYLLAGSRLYKVETKVLNYLKRSVHLAAQHDIVASFSRLRAELAPLTRDPFEKKAFEEFDLITWLEAKTAGKSFCQIVQNKTEKELGKRRKPAPKTKYLHD